MFSFALYIFSFILNDDKIKLCVLTHSIKESLGMAKIKDIAEQTGFSITTISRVLNQDKSFNVSEETRLKIMTASEELNYVPLNQRQKGKGKKKALTFGLIYWYDVSEELTDPYYLSMRIAVENYCEKNQIKLSRYRMGETILEQLELANLDGIIALGKYSDTEILNFHHLHVPLVLLDCYHKHYEIDVVMANLHEATEDIITYLKSANLKSIGFIGGIEETLDGEVLQDARLTTYQQAFKTHLSTTYLGKFNADSGYDIMTHIIQKGKLQPAYIIASDSLALGCLKALNENNIQVPNQVSLISYNNTSLSQYTIPALTTIDLNTKMMGETAVDLLLEKITTHRKIAKKIFIPTQLIKRESSI